MNVLQLLQRLPKIREIFPREIVQEWSMADFVKGEQQQRAATWKGLNAWWQSTRLDFLPIPTDDSIE
jgi:hypothetical protein